MHTEATPHPPPPESVTWHTVRQFKKVKACVLRRLTKIKVNSFFLLPEEFTMGSGMDISPILY